MIGLVAFDLDGTLVRGETCVEAIARRIGRTEECAAFERLSMRNRKAVAAAREEMATWFDGYSQEELDSGLSDLVLAPGTEQAFNLLRSRGVSTAIVSITWSGAVEWFGRRLGADYTLGTQLRGNHVDHVWPEDKGLWLMGLSNRLGLAPRQVAAVGDSDNDRELLEAARLRFFVGMTRPAIPQVIHDPGGNIHDIVRQALAAD